MRIVVMGAGGVGGYFGGQLAKAGHDVIFVARGAHLAALQERGLTVESSVAPLALSSVNAVEQPPFAASADVVMFCVKMWDAESAAHQLAPLLAKGGIVIPFQNGVESHLILRRALGIERVAGGVAHISVTIRSPSVIAHTGTTARLRVGSFSGETWEPVRAFAEAGRAAGVDVNAVPDITRSLWEKFVLLVAMSGVCSLARQPIGVVRTNPELRTMLVASMQETVAVARTQGIAFADDFADKQMRFIDELPPAMRPSMLHDLNAGKPLEAPWLAGAVARMGNEAKIAVPVSTTIFAALKPWRNGAQRV